MIRAYYTIYGTGTKDNPTKLSKREAAAMLAQARAEHRASNSPWTFGWGWIRSNRRDLMQAYAIIHPSHPSIAAMIRRAKRAKRTVSPARRRISN